MVWSTGASARYYAVSHGLWVASFKLRAASNVSFGRGEDSKETTQADECSAAGSINHRWWVTKFGNLGNRPCEFTLSRKG